MQVDPESSVPDPSASGKTPPHRLRWLHAAVGLALAATALIWVGTRIDLRAIGDVLAGARLRWFGLGFALFYLSLPLRAWRWRILQANVGAKVGVPTLTSAIFRAWTINCILPGRSGDVYSAFVLKAEHGLAAVTTLGTIFTARVLDLMVLVALVGSLFVSTLRGRESPVFETIAYAVLGLGGVLLVGILLLHRVPWFLRRLPRAVTERCERFQAAVLGSARSVPSVLGLTVILWLLEAVRLWCVLAALRLPRPAVEVSFLALGAAVITALPITPAGLGSVELFYQQSLQTLGISEVAATSAAVLDRIISYWFILLVGGLFLGLRHWISFRSSWS